jgi:hypothetical protein
VAAHGGGAIDENIDSSEPAEHLGYDSLDGGIIAGVSDESLHTALRCSRDVRGGGFEYGAIPRNQGDAGGNIARSSMYRWVVWIDLP